jgi:hypothetical protein
MSKPLVPHQAQAQGLRHNEEFHDLGVPHPGMELDEDSGGNDTMPFLKEDAVMVIYDAPPPGRRRVSNQHRQLPS